MNIIKFLKNLRWKVDPNLIVKCCPSCFRGFYGNNSIEMELCNECWCKNYYNKE